VGYGAIGGLMGSITQIPMKELSFPAAGTGQSAGNLYFHTPRKDVPILLRHRLTTRFPYHSYFRYRDDSGIFISVQMSANTKAAEVEVTPAETAASEKRSVWEMVALVFRNPPLCYLFLLKHSKHMSLLYFILCRILF
jgi:hypothetical protein